MGFLRLPYFTQPELYKEPVLKLLTSKKSVKNVRSYQDFGTTSYQATNGSITAAAKRYRYTGMERDDETGLNYHNARYYIPWLGRWLNPDPIGIGDGVNVYAYCKNNPVNGTDTSGTQTNKPFITKQDNTFIPDKVDKTINTPAVLKKVDAALQKAASTADAVKFNIHIRSFISAETTQDPLGRDYHGDNREPSVREDVTARGRAALQYNTESKDVKVLGRPRADMTVREDFFGGQSKQRGVVKYNTNQYNKGDSKVVDIMYSTYNPLTPEIATPAVDVNARFVLNYNKDNNTLNVAFTAKGDKYPSLEAFVEDGAGNRVLLGVSKESGSPGTELGGGPSDLRFTGNVTLNLDAKGNFTGVTTGTGKDAKTYTIEEWNKLVTSKFNETITPQKTD
jgi:RHS repeat-associated protein